MTSLLASKFLEILNMGVASGTDSKRQSYYG